MIPWERQAVGAGEAAKLFGLSKDRFLRNIACAPGFPARVSQRPASWIAGDLVAYRDRMVKRQNYATER